MNPVRNIKSSSGRNKISNGMKLIVGLGNPGKIYTDSRHNIGFLVIKALAHFSKTNFKKEGNTFSLTAKCRIKNKNLLLAQPLTFMNLSGLAVSALLKKYKIGLPRSFYKEENVSGKKERGLDNLLVVCDDLDLEFGRLKIKPAGSSAGHHGLQSIIDSIGTDEFARLRIGIGRPPHQLVSRHVRKADWCGGRPIPNIDSARYVLSPFTQKEKEQLKGIIERASQCCQTWITEGINKSMNIFNKR